MSGDDAATSSDGDDPFPTLRVRRHVALIGLSTALPSGPFFASGRLGERQLTRLEELLEQTGRQSLFRVVLMHHPPAHHTVRWRKSLRDGAALRESSHDAGRSSYCMATPTFPRRRISIGANGRNLAIGVPSASAIGKHVDRYATYHLYRIQRGEVGWRLRVAVRTYSLDRGRFVPEDGRRLRLALAAAPA